MGLFPSKQQRLNNKLWTACYNGKLTKVEQLLAEGADTEMRSDGKTPLLMAASNGHVNTVRLLIDKGAKTSARDSEGRTLLITAIRQGERKVTEMLLEQRDFDLDIKAKTNSDVTALHQAAERGWDNIVLALLEKGADIHAKMDTGKTPLHWAASGGNFSTVKLLLEKGADAHALDNYGNKPESVARKYYPGVADFLRDQAAIPAVPAAAPGWKLTAPDEIAFTSEKTGTGYCLTEIFNFTSRIYNCIARNLKTNAESQAIRFFDEFPDKTILENAYQMLAKQGGKADPASIHGAVLNKKPLQ
ncbi:MAG: ankyrin repeat domain-containing protein [Alphaproteobacteria bacterium]|nr:ankyrin repeat domain-containing protein [Alphaproteobacteria bacterium]